MKVHADRGIDRGHRALSTAVRSAVETGLGEGDEQGEQGMD